MKILLFTIALGFVMNAAFTQDKTTAKPGSQAIQTIQVPDFADPQVKQFYQSYTDYTIKVVKAIRQKDEAATMQLFRTEGRQYGNKMHEMENKVRSNPAEEKKWEPYIMKMFPYQKEIVQSAYYKKFTQPGNKL